MAALTGAERATLIAFAEALLPPGGSLPGAGGEDGVSVVEPVERMLESAPQRGRSLIRLALRLFERSPFPHRFSRMRIERRIRHIERMESSRVSLRRDLLLALKFLTCFVWGRNPEVMAAAGVELTCEVAPDSQRPEWDPPAPPLDRAALERPDGVERCDVVIVGSGAGGASAARVLAERGLDVIVVEDGDYHDAESYSSDPLESSRLLIRDGGMTFCEGRPAIPLPIGRCVGGTTVMNSGTCLRPPDDVLTHWRNDFGLAWADELEREFEAVERALWVEPVDPATAGRNAELCRQGCDELGVSHGPITRNAGCVTRCGTCPSGCALDAKQAMHVSELPRAVAAGARVRAGARVNEILVENGRAVGVATKAGEGGERYEVRARAVVLAAGAVGTPELLLSQGLANESGHLGRHLHIHPACWVGALYDEQVRGWEGVMQSWYVDEWSGRGLFLEATFTPLPFGAQWLAGAGPAFKQRVEDYDRLAVIGVHLSDRSEGRVALRKGRLRIGYSLSREDARTIAYGIARAADIHFAAGATEVYPTLARVERIIAGEQERLVENGGHRPSQMHLEAFHPMGTARISSDPGSGVVSPSGETHDVPGLWIADGSVFPSAIKVNPMITIMGVARRIAAQLSEQLA